MGDQGRVNNVQSISAFSRRLIVLLLILALTVTTILYAGKKKVDSNVFMNALIDKHKRALSIKSPKIILAGGSSVGFGVNSKTLQDSLNMPVVNFGLQAVLGLDYILAEAKRYANKGDIIILSSEYLIGIKCDDMDYMELAIDADPGMFKLLSNDEKRKLLTNAVSLHQLQKCFWRIVTGNKDFLQWNDTIFTYDRRGYNEYGDEVSHTYKKPPNYYVFNRSELNHNMSATELNSWTEINQIHILQKFIQQLNAQGIKLYYVHPSIGNSYFIEKKPGFEKLYSQMKSELGSIVLTTPDAFVLPDSCFYDTQYHLTKSGREMRTQKLIPVLRTVIHTTN